MKKPELLAPAGSFEKAKVAFMYGADAVYCGTASLSLRSRAEVDDSDLEKTIKYAHSIGKKVYAALNIYAWDTNYEEIEKSIKGFKNIVPYTKMLISYDGYLIPLEEKNFRVNSSTMGFMYNGEISCVGMITNIIGDDIDDSDDGQNIFGAIQKVINMALKTILPTKERNLCIVNPIAIFYDS